MTKRSEKTPTATERIAERVRELRTFAGFDQGAAAEMLTALGAPTQVSTVTRIESGAQPPTVEQVLLLALIGGPGGLRNLLTPPFTIGNLVVGSDDDLDVLLGGQVDRSGPMPEILRQYGVRAEEVWAQHRDRGIANSLGTTPKKVATTAERLFGHSAHEEVLNRLSTRLAELDQPPAGESPQYRAYRSHAVRAVTKEIREALR